MNRSLQTIRGWTPILLMLAALAVSIRPAAALDLSPPGSYALPNLGQAPNGPVLDETGRVQSLHALMGDHFILLSFIYAACSDERGCPLATQTLLNVQKHLSSASALAADVRLLTLSFDPAHDTPAVMADYGRHLRGALDWRFLTSANEAALQPILDAYGQGVDKVYAANGQFTGTFNHVLRVFLIDRQRRIRNSYSLSTLQTEVLLNDLRTLALEARAPAVQTGGPMQAPFKFSPSSARFGLPPRPQRADSQGAIELGRRLFFDRRLSFNNTLSCALCHVPTQGFTSNETATSVGIEGHAVRRNAPTLLNVAYQRTLFHDGRERDLAQQAWGPLLAAHEMGNPSIGYVLDKLRGLPDYAGQFERVFRRGVHMETLGQALAAYQRSLIAADTPFDRWYYGQQTKALSPSAQAGFALFTGKAGCVTCHAIESNAALFSDQAFHDTGIGYRASFGAAPTPLTLGEHLTVQLAPAQLAAISATPPADLGRYEVTQNPADRWRYKTPSLRNVALTAPYMHDGSLADLSAVLAFYNQGGIAHEGLDSALRPLNLTASEQTDLLAFLNGLTSPAAAILAQQEMRSSVGNPR